MVAITHESWRGAPGTYCGPHGLRPHGSRRAGGRSEVRLRLVISRIVYLPLFAPNLGGKRFALDEGNPGIGGSQFTTIQFAMLLAQSRPDWQVVLGNDVPLQLAVQQPNLRQLQVADLDSFYGTLTQHPPGIVLSMSIHFWRVAPEVILESPGVPIVWSRHPFDEALRLPAVRQRYPDVVCVGEHQWHSNLARGRRTHFIQEIYLQGTSDPVNPETGPGHPPRAVHVSSLVRAKGFLEVAKAWPALRRMLPGLTLEVIGGNKLYGGATEHGLIPANPDFARDILEHIPESDIREGVVRFHGTLGKGKSEIVRRSDFALLNPTGTSEAFPATPLECMSLGVPVIASDDYGMADCMRSFPELSLRNPDGITGRVRWLLADHARYRALRRRSLKVAGSFADATAASLGRWHRLLDTLAEAGSRSIELAPALPFHGSRALLVYRRHLHPVLRTFRHHLRAVTGS